jgi:hypothetical protein
VVVDAGREAEAGNVVVMDATSEPPPACMSTSCKVKVQYECRQDGLMPIKELSFILKIVNTGTEPVLLDSLSARYYFTADSTATQQADCDFAALDCTKVAFSFKAVTPAKTNADRYLEVAINASGTLAPGADTGEIQIRIHDVANQATYMQSNDYSFFSTGAVFFDRTQVPGYVDTSKVWGAEP